MNAYLSFNAEVETALAEGAPVVALESTLISHGMPYPQNAETARAVEDIIRAKGAVPATIALLDGKICVGLDEAGLERLATDPDVAKASRRDLPYLLSQRKVGATTVAATMICADLAGIRIFATGGVGGVHRGGETSLDISADLQELARTRVAVICAGAKSILDIGRTLEVLETLGVPVVGYGTDHFPAFYTRESGYGVDARVDTLADLAALLRTKWALGLDGGVLVANPVPAAEAMPVETVTAATERALAEVSAQGLQGKAVTPFLLSRVTALTEGASLKTNIALVKHNAEVAAGLARALSESV
ncbi:pseudouridine-5'-phosphate glycosidase [soil metagenome]